MSEHDDGHGSSHPTVATLLLEARRDFERECTRAHREHDSALDRCFRRAIAPLIVALETATRALVQTADDNRRARHDLAQVQSLGKRKAFSSIDPVCGRCIALLSEASPDRGGEPTRCTLAVEGDTCSRCGTLVCVQRADETDAEFRARLRNPNR